MVVAMVVAAIVVVAIVVVVVAIALVGIATVAFGNAAVAALGKLATVPSVVVRGRSGSMQR